MPTGLDKILTNLNNQIQLIEGDVRSGVLEAVINVLGESLPETPIDTGNLRNSAYIDDARGGNLAIGDKNGTVIIKNLNLRTDYATVGYRSNYALAVHEINKNYRAPGTSWKFLEKALKRTFRSILSIIHKRAKIK